jgi:ATP-binding cassette subfamily B protein
MIFKHYGLFNVQAALREIAGVTSAGTDLYTLSRVAERFGFETEGARIKFEHLSQIPLPCIAHYEGNHFVVVHKATGNEVWIADPASDKEKIVKEEFLKKWNGIVLLLQPTREVFQSRDVMEIAEQYSKREKFIAKSFYQSLLYPFRRVLGEIVLGSLILIALSLALPFFTQSIIDSVLVFQNKNLLYAILIAMLVVFVLQVILTYTRHILLAQFRVEFEFEFFSRFFRKFLSLTQQYFDAHKREDFIQRFQENLKIRNLFSAGTLQSALDVVLVLALLPVLFWYNTALAFIAVGFLMLFVLTTVLFTPRIKRLQEKIFLENAKTMGSFLDTLLGMTTVKLLTAETQKFWEWRHVYKRALNKVLSASKTQITLNSLLRTIMFSGQVCVYWMGAYFTFNGELSIGQYIAFISIFTMMMNSANTVNDLWFVLTDLSVTFARLNDVFVQEPERADLATQATTLLSSEIQFKGVSFSYDSSHHLALKNVSLELKPGEHIGIVGRNGSGKTTLVKLIVKMYEHYSGMISIGGTELRNIHPHYLRMKVFMLPQEVHLFNGTIADNISVANPSATIEDVISASKKAELHDFISSLYLGYNHKIGESGSNLSGGQRLRLAFARLFISNPEIIILDEASSALDVIAEQNIMQHVYNQFRDKTIISIAHRMSTLQHTNRIIVLDDGSIAEEGSHTELMSKQGTYFSFMNTYIAY